MTDGGTYVNPTDAGNSLRVYDSGDTDYIDIAHDGSDVNLTTANTFVTSSSRPWERGSSSRLNAEPR